jgi:hypothetical protein
VQAGDLEVALASRRAELGKLRRGVQAVRLEAAKAEPLVLVKEVARPAVPAGVPTGGQSESMALTHA